VLSETKEYLEKVFQVSGTNQIHPINIGGLSLAPVNESTDNKLYLPINKIRARQLLAKIEALPSEFDDLCQRKE